MAKKDELGRWGEQIAADHLASLGYRIVDRNWRCPQGEIDIVARHRSTLVIAEVKTRRSIAFGHPFEAVTPAKLSRLNRLAFAWCAAHEGWHGRIRLDVVSVLGSPESPAGPTVEIFEAVRA
jgi:putative endonuclease